MQPATHSLLLVPPFAEEMMKARQHFTQFAVAMEKHGAACGVIDVRGTGDAEGELANVTWDDWCNDVANAFQTLEAMGPVTIVGLRLGALLALDACAKHGLKPCGAMLWEPQLVGKTAIKQFTRIAAIGAKVQGRVTGDTQESDGQEVGGYWISKALEAQIAATVAPSALSCAHALVARLAQEAAPAIPPAWESTIAAWRAGGASVETLGVESAAFWSTPEITVNHALNEKSIAWWRQHIQGSRA